jgi:hypothetical protein
MISFRDDGIHIRGFLANVGFGPASSICISLQCDQTSRQTSVFIQSLAAGQQVPEHPADSNSLRHDLWRFGLPRGEIWDEFVGQMPEFTITYNTLFNRQRRTRYIPASKEKDAAGVHFWYTQEVIDLNRDLRTTKLVAEGDNENPVA